MTEENHIVIQHLKFLILHIGFNIVQLKKESILDQKELKPAPEKIVKLVTDLQSEYTEFLNEDDDAVELATEYIAEKVVGQTSFADCLHIALATINRADLLVSWNFKHIVNIERILGYNSINIKNGYKQLEIRSPRDLMNYEN